MSLHVGASCHGPISRRLGTTGAPSQQAALRDGPSNLGSSPEYDRAAIRVLKWTAHLVEKGLVDVSQRVPIGFRPREPQAGTGKILALRSLTVRSLCDRCGILSTLKMAWLSQCPWPFSGKLFYLFGFWAPTTIPLSPESKYFLPGVAKQPFYCRLCNKQKLNK